MYNAIVLSLGSDRCARLRTQIPVTAEIAGSSPVAPANSSNRT
jgi:hypothetical protein